MFQSPENRGRGEEMDLDFTKEGALKGIEVKEDYESIKDTIADLKNKIASAERGVELAKKLGDTERTAQMEARKKEFEELLAMLEQTPKEMQEFWVEPEDDDTFSRAVESENGGAIRKMERKGEERRKRNF